MRVHTATPHLKHGNSTPLVTLAVQKHDRRSKA